MSRFRRQTVIGNRKTIGAPRPPWEQMRDGIKDADCVVLVATPRYIQEDVHERTKTGMGISELLHVEVGMAVASDHPVLAFVLQGTDVGAFLPQLVQYIILNPSDQEDVRAKWPLIANYFRSALLMIEQRWLSEERRGLGRAVGIVLGVIGAATVIDSIFKDGPNER